MKKVVVFGSSGLMGQQIVKLGAQAGYQMVCFSRKKLVNLPDNTIEVIAELNDVETIKRTIADADIVISALGHNRTSRSPWAKQTSPESMLANFYEKLAIITNSLIKAPGLVHVSAVGVGDDFNLLPGWYRLFVYKSNIQKSYEDHANALKIIESKFPNALVVKPVILSNSKTKKLATEIGLPFSLSNSLVSREAVARFIIDNLANDAQFGRRISLST